MSQTLGQRRTLEERARLYEAGFIRPYAVREATKRQTLYLLLCVVGFLGIVALTVLVLFT